MERIIEVGAPPRDVFVYRGAQRETYSCAPDCEARVKIGDSKPFFETTLAQTAARNSQAQGIATSR
jgi:hypothetical protein